MHGSDADGRRHLPQYRHSGRVRGLDLSRAERRGHGAAGRSGLASAPIRPPSTASSGSSRLSIPGLGILKIYFQQGSDIGGAIAQISAQNNAILRIAPPGITPPNMIRFNASNVPVVQVTLVEQDRARAADLRLRAEFSPRQAVHHLRPVDPGPVRRQAAADHRRRRSHALEREGLLADGCRGRPADHERDRAGRRRADRTSASTTSSSIPARNSSNSFRLCRSACAKASRCCSATSPRSAIATPPRPTSPASMANAPAI